MANPIRQCYQDPGLTEIGSQQLQQDLSAIEISTYTEFVRSGRLNQELPSLLAPIHAHIADEMNHSQPSDPKA